MYGGFEYYEFAGWDSRSFSISVVLCVLYVIFQIILLKIPDNIIHSYLKNNKKKWQIKPKYNTHINSYKRSNNGLKMRDKMKPQWS